jgi:hypothetical protein
MISDLAGRHRGATAWIVGRGPSLLELAAADVGPGPVLALNNAIVQVRALALPNPLYSLQKDGCYGGAVPLEERWPCGACPRAPIVAPEPPETLLVSADEAPWCLEAYSPRYTFRVLDLGLPAANMSAPVAVQLARLMGVRAIVMVAHDAYRSSDARRVEADGQVVLEPDVLAAYAQAAELAIEAADGLALTWWPGP